MATYLEGGVDFIPPVIPFQPNYNLILSTLQYRQGQYDQGFAQLKNSASSVINSQLLNETNIEKRKQILSNAEYALKSLPTVDLSLPQNVAAAKNVFRPFYEDESILVDMKETKSYMSERNRGLALRNADKEEERKRFWNIGIQDLDDWAAEFSKASTDQLKGMRSRRYVGKPMIGEQVLEMFQSGKLKREVDNISGKVKITDTNGKEVITPLTNLYLSLAQNDPESMEAFNVYGRVKRNQFIRDNELRFGSREAAATEHDRLLVADFKESNTADLKETNEALGLVNQKIAKWKERGVENLTDDEAQKYASDINAQKQLTQSKQYYEKANLTAENNILGNPTAYLGQVYLSKSARDLAKSLSAFGSRKVDTNPIYKDLIHPYELEQFKTNENMRSEKFKSELKKDEARYDAELKAIYGDGDSKDGDGKDGDGGLGAKTGSSGLNIPVVQDNAAGSGVKFRDKDGLADAYAGHMEFKRQVVSRTVDAKINLIDQVLSAGELTDEKGNVLDQTQKQNLRSNGALLDYNVKKAEKKIDIMNETKDPQRFNALALKKKVEQNMNLWRAADVWTQDVFKQLSGNLQGSRKEDGWVFKHMIRDGRIVNNENDFIAELRNDPEYKAALDRRLKAGEKSAADKQQQREIYFNKFGYYPANDNLSTDRATIENRLQADFRKKFKEYRDDVVKGFNTMNNGGGFSFTARYDPMAGSGGGGVNARQLMFTGRSSVSGEDADVFVTDLFSKITGSEGDEDVVYAAGPDSPDSVAVDTDGDTNQDDDVKRLANEVIKPNMIASVKAGKDAPLKYYTISSSQVASNNPNYHVYTMTFDPDYLSSITSTENKPGIISKDEAKKLAKGVSVYIKADKDNTLMAQRSSIGEIEMLLLSAKTNGVLEDEVAPGYRMRIEKMIQGGYKIVTTYPFVNPENPQGKPFTKTTIVPQGTDLTYTYYNTIARLSELHQQIEATSEVAVKSNPNRRKYTEADIDAIAAQQAQGF